MRVLLDRSRPARDAVALLATVAILSAGFLTVAPSASASGDLGLRGSVVFSEPQETVPAPSRHRHARRIWAASGTRPLRITLRNHHADRRWASARRPVSARLVARWPASSGAVDASMPLHRPALVSIYEDRTLLAGDAVMMADGIHVFRGGVGPSHRAADFVRLTLVASLDWRLRQSLDILDQNPPARWPSLGSAAS